MMSTDRALVFARHSGGGLLADDAQKRALARRLAKLSDRRYAPASVIRLARQDLERATLELQRMHGWSYQTCQRQLLGRSSPMAPWYALWCRESMPDGAELFQDVVRFEDPWVMPT